MVFEKQPSLSLASINFSWQRYPNMNQVEDATVSITITNHSKSVLLLSPSLSITITLINDLINFRWAMEQNAL